MRVHRLDGIDGYLIDLGDGTVHIQNKPAFDYTPQPIELVVMKLCEHVIGLDEALQDEIHSQR